MVLQAVTVHPLSHAEGGKDQRLQNGAAGDPFEAVGGRSAGEGDADRTAQGVGAQFFDGGTVSGVDGEEHGCPCELRSV